MFWIEFQYLFCGLVFSGKRFDLFDHDVVSVPSHFFIWHLCVFILLSRNFSQINIYDDFYSILCSEVKDFLDFQLLKMVENVLRDWALLEWLVDEMINFEYWYLKGLCNVQEWQVDEIMNLNNAIWRLELDFWIWLVF